MTSPLQFVVLVTFYRRRSMSQRSAQYEIDFEYCNEYHRRWHVNATRRGSVGATPPCGNHSRSYTTSSCYRLYLLLLLITPSGNHYLGGGDCSPAPFTNMAPFLAPQPILDGFKERAEAIAVQGEREHSNHYHLSHGRHRGQVVSRDGHRQPTRLCSRLLWS